MLSQQDPPRLGRNFGFALRTPAGYLFLGYPFFSRVSLHEV